METVVGLFDSYEDAERAVRALQEAGFINERISLLARNRAQRADKGRGEEIAETAGVSALGGSIAGGLTGLLVGLGLLTVPGLGPVLAAGSLAATLGATAAGAGIGAATGGLLGALAGLGLSGEEAEAYAEGVKRGGVIVLVEAEEGRGGVAKNILDQAGAINLDARRSQWIEEGWTHFDENVIPPQQFPGGISTL